MALSVFEIIGPPMIGPSSSHTAGACRAGWLARALLAEAPLGVEFLLHGSFAATGAGHGTPEALAAGMMGFAPDDDRLEGARAGAAGAGIDLSYGEVDLGPQAHPNSVVIVARGATRAVRLTAASVGGGSVVATEIDGLPADLRGTLVTLVFWHRDTPGFLARVTAVLAGLEINVAAIRTGRTDRGAEALTTVEIDGGLPTEACAFFGCMPAVGRLAVVPVLPGF